MKNKRIIPLMIGLVILSIFLLMAFFPTLFTNYGLKEMFDPWLKCSKDHILGTNDMGYDIFTELVYGCKETLMIGVISSGIAILLGTTIGVLSTFKGVIGTIFNGIINVFILLPRLITLIVLAAFIGNSSISIILLISLFSFVGIARNVRVKVLHMNNELFIENLKIQGFNKTHIIIHHMIPNLYDVLISRFLLAINSTIMLESTLSFLGIGDLYHPTWGTMINFAYKRGAFIRNAYNYLLVPGIAIMLLSFSFYLISVYFENKKESIKEI